MKTLLKRDENTTLAASLYTLQGQIEFLQEQEADIKARLLENLTTQGVQALRLDDGTTFSVAHRESLKAKNPEKAMEWAKENNVLSIDMKKARELLRRSLKLPSFFKIEKGEEYLIIKRV